MKSSYFFLFKLILVLVICFGLFSLVSAKDIVYVIRTDSSFQPRVTNAIEDLGYSYDVIKDSQIVGTNFSKYQMIIVMDELLSNKDYLPITNKTSLIANTYYISDWKIADYTGSLVSSGYATIKIKTPTDISSGLSSPIQVYNQKQIALDTLPYPYKRAAGLVNALSTDNSNEYPVVGTINTGGKLYPSGYAGGRMVYFGLTQSDYWTSEAETLFKNSITWLLLGSDGDGDGVLLENDCNDSDSTKWQYLGGYVDNDDDGFGVGNITLVCSGDALAEGYVNNSLDCNDNNVGVCPDATEIPYDEVDNDCNGFDLADIDLDGYCNAGYSIQNKTLQCHLETTLVGTDCDDTDSSTNPGSGDLDKNCKNNAPLFVSVPGKITVRETALAEIIVEATDPEDDEINYSINDSRFTNNGNGNFTWQTSYLDAGRFFVNITVSDGLLSNSTRVEIEITNKNQAPVCSEIPDMTWEEDTTFSINLSEYCSDPDGEQIAFGVNNTSIETEIILDFFDNWKGIANFSVTKNWFGEDWIVFYVTDGKNITLTDTIILSVTPVNDAPNLSRQFDDISWKENVNLTNYLNLSKFFSDVDSPLSYSFTGNHFINVSIDENNSLVSFYPTEDFFGSENIVFGATDGEFLVYSDVLTLNVSLANKAPAFLPLDCQTEIEEEGEYNCVVNATDRENDSVSFSVGEKNHLQCSFEGDLLRYSPLQDYNGLASCALVVSDAEGFSSVLFSVNVSSINDVPLISGRSPSSPIALRVNQQQQFSITPQDVDGDVLNSTWFLNGTETATNSFSYLFSSATRGNFLLEALVFDSEFNDSTFWNIFVGDETDFTCSQNNGDICSADEFCPVAGRIFNSSDSNSCCSVSCAKSPPKFLDVKDRCTNLSSGVILSFNEPDNNEEYIIGEDEEIDVELEIKNNLEEDLDFKVKSYLYDLTDDKIVAHDSDSVNVDKKEEEIAEFVFDINKEDLDENNNYAIFAYIVDGVYCQELYRPIIISREEHALVFENVDLVINNVDDNNYLDVTVDLKNIGLSDEDYFVKVTNSELKINFKTEDFSVNEGRDDSISFSILLPQSIAPKNYTLTFTAEYEDGRDTVTEIISPEQIEQARDAGSSGSQTTFSILTESSQESGIDLIANSEAGGALNAPSESSSRFEGSYSLGDMISFIVILSIVVVVIAIIYLIKRT